MRSPVSATKRDELGKGPSTSVSQKKGGKDSRTKEIARKNEDACPSRSPARKS